MNKEVKKYLNYLKANEYIWDYEKKNDYIILRYGLSTIKDTEISIEYNDNLEKFIENIEAKVDKLKSSLIEVINTYEQSIEEIDFLKLLTHLSIN